MSSAGIVHLCVQGVIILFFPEPLDALAMLQNDCNCRLTHRCLRGLILPALLAWQVPCSLDLFGHFSLDLLQFMTSFL